MDIFKKIGEDKYLVFASTDKSRIKLEKYKKLFDEIKEQVKLVNGDKMFKYGKDFTKIKFKRNDDLPYNKMINIPVCVLIISSIFKENNNYYPQFCYMIVFMNMIIL